jgi:hypothetical protein
LSSATVELERSRSKPVSGVAVVLAIVFGAHAAALGNRLLLDDFMRHRDDPALRTLGGLVALVTRPYALPETEPQGLVLRPVSAAFDWLSWQLVRSSPLAHHALDVLLHLGVVALVYTLAVEVGARGFAPFAALLFGVHPLTVAAVAALSGRPLLLGALGLLWAQRCLGRERRVGWGALTAAVGAAVAVGSHEAYRWAAPVVLAAGALGSDRRRFAAVFAAACVGSLAMSWWSPPIAGASPGAVLVTTAALLARFGSSLLWPRSPVLSFTPSAPPSIVCLALLAGVLVLVAWGLKRRGVARRPWLAGAALVVLVPFALGETAAAARSASDRGAYVVLLGAVLLATAVAPSVSARRLRHVPAWSVAGFVAFVPLDAAHALDARDELTVLHRTAAGRDDEAALARATIDTRVETALAVCVAYARSHGASTRAHGCVASALLDAGDPAQALPWARIYESARPNRRHARALLLQALAALNQTAEIQALKVKWGALVPKDVPRRRDAGAAR